MIKIFGTILTLFLLSCSQAIGTVEAQENEECMKGSQFLPKYQGVADVPDVPLSGWSQSGQLETGNPNRAVNLQGKFPVIENYTVQFNLATPVTTGVRKVAAQAELIWSVQGNSVRRLISVYDGTSITGSAQAVSVKLFDDTRVAPPVPAITYDGSIQVSKGTRGSNKQPPYFALGNATVANGGSASFPIPDDIGAISLLVSVGPQSPGFTIPPGFVIAEVIGSAIAQVRYDPRDYDWFPLNPGATIVTVRIAAAAPATDYDVNVFLGIDG